MRRFSQLWPPARDNINKITFTHKQTQIAASFSPNFFSPKSSFLKLSLTAPVLFTLSTSALYAIWAESGCLGSAARERKWHQVAACMLFCIYFMPTTGITPTPILSFKNNNPLQLQVSFLSLTHTHI